MFNQTMSSSDVVDFSTEKIVKTNGRKVLSYLTMKTHLQLAYKRLLAGC